jgi:HD-GYP domain-containing protein (c-di-GMP phosphodiesterase class II)
MNLSTGEVGRTELAGLLHDIGMIGVAEEIMHKTDQLTPEEYEEVKKHVSHSIKILEDIKQLGEVIEIVRYHHERYDGSGYPQGLRGEEIPVGARIIAVADAYDGMISKRAYRDAKNYDEAMAALDGIAGSQLDPDIIKVFKEIFPETNAALEAYVKEMDLENAK